MKRYADEVIICYDSDEAGQKATARAIQLLRNAGLVVRVITIPSGKDPDEFIKSKGDKGHEAFKNLLESGGNDVDYRINKIKSAYNLELPEHKVAYLKEAVKVLTTLDNVVEQEIYASKLSADVGVSKESVMQQLSKLKRRARNDEQKKEFKRIQQKLNGRDDKFNADRYRKPRSVTAEEALLSYLLKNPDRIHIITKQLDEDKFQSEFNRKLYIYFKNKILSGNEPLMTVSGDFSSDEVAKIYQLANAYSTQVANDETLQEYIDVIVDEFMKHNLRVNVLSIQEIICLDTKFLQIVIRKN
jgi:DNA primase